MCLFGHHLPFAFSWPIGTQLKKKKAAAIPAFAPSLTLSTLHPFIQPIFFQIVTEKREHQQQRLPLRAFKKIGRVGTLPALAHSQNPGSIQQVDDIK